MPFPFFSYLLKFYTAVVSIEKQFPQTRKNPASSSQKRGYLRYKKQEREGWRMLIIRNEDFE
jgi:hypothetical protein